MILKRLEEFYNRGVVETSKNASFDKDFLDPSLADEASDEHLFESIVLLYTLEGWVVALLESFIMELDLHDSSISTLANLVHLLEICLNQGSLFDADSSGLLGTFRHNCLRLLHGF